MFPVGQGYADGLVPGWNWAFIGSAVYHSLLPAFTIVITSVAGWMLQMRNVMITTIGEDYVLAAQAKGLSSRRVVFTYAARNAILPSCRDSASRSVSSSPARSSWRSSSPTRASACCCSTP